MIYYVLKYSAAHNGLFFHIRNCEDCTYETATHFWTGDITMPTADCRLHKVNIILRVWLHGEPELDVTSTSRVIS